MMCIRDNIRDGGITMLETLSNMNKAISSYYRMLVNKRSTTQELFEIQENEPMVQGLQPMEQEIGLLIPNLELYTERMHMYFENELRECIFVIIGINLYIFDEFGKSLLIKHPINVLTEIEYIIQCLKRFKRESY